MLIARQTVEIWTRNANSSIASIRFQDVGDKKSKKSKKNNEKQEDNENGDPYYHFKLKFKPKMDEEEWKLIFSTCDLDMDIDDVEREFASMDDRLITDSFDQIYIFLDDRRTTPQKIVSALQHHQKSVCQVALAGFNWNDKHIDEKVASIKLYCPTLGKRICLQYSGVSGDRSWNMTLEQAKKRLLGQSFDSLFLVAGLVMVYFSFRWMS